MHHREGGTMEQSSLSFNCLVFTRSRWERYWVTRSLISSASTENEKRQRRRRRGMDLIAAERWDWFPPPSLFPLSSPRSSPSNSLLPLYFFPSNSCWFLARPFPSLVPLIDQESKEALGWSLYPMKEKKGKRRKRVLLEDEPEWNIHVCTERMRNLSRHGKERWIDNNRLDK